MARRAVGFLGPFLDGHSWKGAGADEPSPPEPVGSIRVAPRGAGRGRGELAQRTGSRRKARRKPSWTVQARGGTRGNPLRRAQRRRGRGPTREGQEPQGEPREPRPVAAEGRGREQGRRGPRPPSPETGAGHNPAKTRTGPRGRRPRKGPTRRSAPRNRRNGSPGAQLAARTALRGAAARAQKSGRFRAQAAA